MENVQHYLERHRMPLAALLLALLVALLVRDQLDGGSTGAMRGTWNVIGGSGAAQSLTLAGIGDSLAGDVALDADGRNTVPVTAQLNDTTLVVSFLKSLPGLTGRWTCIRQDDANLSCTDALGSPFILSKAMAAR